jgi:hypothetical protein
VGADGDLLLFHRGAGRGRGVGASVTTKVIWRGEDDAWRRLMLSFRHQCSECSQMKPARLCNEHRELVSGDQRFLDRMAYADNQARTWAAQEQSRSGGITRG